MITQLANIIADFFVEKRLIIQKEKEIYRYGCEVMISALMTFSIVIMCGLVTNQFVDAIIFYSVFLIMRRYCGGYHANTHFKCNLIFTLNLLLVLFYVKNIKAINNTFIILLIITSDLLIYWLSPIINDNKPLSNSEILKYRKISLLLSLFFTIISFLLITINKNVSIIISLTFLSVSMAMMIEKLKQEVKSNVCKK